jgi:O-antigen/teichoic acid export membrane protein
MSAVIDQVKAFSIYRVLSHLRTPLYRNAYALMVSTAATSVLGILYWALAARFYSAEVVGMNAAAMSAIFFLSGLAQLNIKGAMVRYIQTAGRSTYRLVAFGYLIVAVLSALAGFLFLEGLALWAPALMIFNSSVVLSWSFILGVVSWSIFSLQDNVLTGLREAVWVPIENILFAILKILLLLLLAGWLAELGVFASWVIPVALTLIPVNWLVFRYLIPRHIREREHRAEPIRLVPLVRFVGGDYVGSLFAIAAATLLPILVINRVGTAANAYFYLAWVIGSSLLILNVNLMSSFTVEAAAEPDKLNELSLRALVHGLRLLVPLVVVVIFLAPLILSLFGRTYAAEGVTLLRLLALVPIAHLFNALFIAIARIHRNVKQMVLIQMTQCLLGLGLSYVLLGIFGITGIGIALLVTEGLVAVSLGLTQGKPLFRPVVLQFRSNRRQA